MAYSISVNHKKLFALFFCAAMLVGCTTLITPPVAEAPRVSHDTKSATLLKSIPPASQNTVVSVYEFQDQTGQLKPNDNFAEYSRAVTQGGLSILNKALLEAGNGHWFDVVERGGLKNLLQERQIIQLTRAQYAKPEKSKGPKPNFLSPLLYAGMLIEGGVIGYDSNIATGGAGANYLGVGGDINYRRDIVTVELRAISVENGQILLSVTSEKTIYSTAVDASIFKYVSFDHLLQMETGFTFNEPPQLAVRQAVETAIYSLIMEGARKHYWHFADDKAGNKALAEYLKTIDEATDLSAVAAPAAPSPSNIIQQPANSSQNKGSSEINDSDDDKTGITGTGNSIEDISPDDNKNSSGSNNDNNIYPVVPANPADYPIAPQVKK